LTNGQTLVWLGGEGIVGAMGQRHTILRCMSFLKFRILHHSMA
jgi:hypothetical protein